jgi:hypothetical protein
MVMKTYRFELTLELPENSVFYEEPADEIAMAVRELIVGDTPELAEIGTLDLRLISVLTERERRRKRRHVVYEGSPTTGCGDEP